MKTQIIKTLILFLIPLYGISQDTSQADFFTSDSKVLNEKSNIIKEIKNGVHLNSKELSLPKRYELVSKDWRNIFKIKNHGFELMVDAIKDSEFKESPKEKITKLKKDREAILSEAEGLFYIVSKERSDIIKSLFATEQVTKIEFNERFFYDLILEVNSIPLRWISLFKNKFYQVKEDLSGGVTGWLQLLKEVAMVVIVFFLGGFFYYIFKKGFKFLEVIQKEHSRKAYKNQRSRLISRWIGRITPILPWAWVISFFTLSEGIIAGGYFKELAIFFPYFTYYAYYRIFRVTIKLFLSNYSFYKFDRDFHLDKKKLNWTSVFLGRVYLSIVVIQHTLLSAGADGFLYNWISNFFFYFLIVVIFYVTHKWKIEIRLVAQKTFSAQFLSVVNKILDGRFSFLSCLFIFVFVVAFQLVFSLYRVAERFDIVRAISAQYFRKKVETKKQDGLGNIKTDIEPEYVDLFEGVGNIEFPLQESQKKVYESVMSYIGAWQSNDSVENISLIYGERGIGKTYLLRTMHKDLSDVEKVFCSFNDRKSQKEELDSLISQVKNKQGKVVVFIDGLQFLFLSKRKGFDLFKDFLNLTQGDSFKNVFWCLGINNYSWEFIESVLNKNRYFNYINKLEKWREEEIEKVILGKHEKSGFELVYDELLYAANRLPENEDVDIEGRYFRILWEETMGNPSLAQKIWIKSLQQMSNKKVKALIPEERNESLVGLPDEFFFVLASIVRHESLSISDIQASTNLDEDIVRNSVKNCLEKGYLLRDRKLNVSISLMAQHAVYSTLKRMNFIYG